MFNRHVVSVVDPFVQDDRYWTFVLTDTTSNTEISEWSITHTALDIPVPLHIRKRTLHGGKQEGSTLIEIETEALDIAVIPTRGMSLLEAKAADVELGWASPVDEIVHPAFIDAQQRGGLGWLDGFNELLVRCGFEWTGHPSRSGDTLYTLHGRIGNTPASTVIVQIEKTSPNRIHVHGLLKEKTFKFADLEIWTRLTVTPGKVSFEILDKATNKSDYERDCQVIYHTNFGPPLLERGSRIIAPVAEVSPFNDVAARELENWNTYHGPTPGYDETVFNCTLHGDQDGATLAALVNATETRGVAIRYSTKALPAFTLWKNTDTTKQGYVTGLEPGTNPPYERKIEEAMGRLRRLGPGESTESGITIEPLTSPDSVRSVINEVERLTAGRKPALRQEQKRHRP